MTFTIDQARTQDLERRGLRNAVVRSDGQRVVVELVHVHDFDDLLAGLDDIPRSCSACGGGNASVCIDCASAPRCSHEAAS